MNIRDIEKLAALSRIDLQEGEKKSLLAEMGAILNYVNQVKEAAAFAADNMEEKPYSRNIWREDANPHESGIFTDVLLASAPARHGQYIKVKKIL